MSVDLKLAEHAVTELLLAMGYDPMDESVRATPARVARAWAEVLGGRLLDAREILKTSFEAGNYDEVVALRGIDFFSTCQHHLLPFRGVAHVAYVPRVEEKGTRVVGLSKLARLVDMHARRLQLQERFTAGIADDLEAVLTPVGVAVVVEARHLCMCARGVKKDGEMVTSVMRGCFREKPEARAEVMRLFGL